MAKQLKPGTLVWVRLRTYPWWPAEIVSEDEPGLAEEVIAEKKPGTVLARFFGEANYCWSPAKNIERFRKRYDVHSKNNSRGLRSAIKEALEAEKERGREPDSEPEEENKTERKRKRNDEEKEESANGSATPKRKRGRPRKSESTESTPKKRGRESDSEPEEENKTERKRKRNDEEKEESANGSATPKRKRGRPRKSESTESTPKKRGRDTEEKKEKTKKPKKEASEEKEKEKPTDGETKDKEEERKKRHERKQQERDERRKKRRDDSKGEKKESNKKEDISQTLLSYNKHIRRAFGDNNDERLVLVLKKLKRLNNSVTIKSLHESGLGKTIKRMSKHKSEEIAKLANELLTFYTAIMDDAIKTGDIVQLNLLAEQKAKDKAEATNGEASAAETKDGEEKKEAVEGKVQDEKEPQHSAGGEEKNTEARNVVEADPPSETPKEEEQPQAETKKSEDTPMTEVPQNGEAKQSPAQEQAAN